MSVFRRGLGLAAGQLLVQLALGCSSDASGSQGTSAGSAQEDDDSEEQDEEDAGSTGSKTDASVRRDAATGDRGKDAGTRDSASEDALSEDEDETGASDGESDESDAGTPGKVDKFSFFVTSLRAMRELSKSQDGFGGDLRFGETGDGAGLRGADKICSTIAEESMPGAGSKVWRAFLSTTKGGKDGGPVHAADRVGDGPWYDRLGRVVALTKTDLIQVRPASADPTIKNDLPNEDGVPNHNPDGTGEVDNHDILTGSNDKGQLYANDVKVTCNDWTKSTPDRADAPRVGHSWPRMGGGGRGGGGGGGGGMENWMSALNEAGCGAGVSIIEMGPPMEQNPTVGSGGGYGGIYCFALTP